MRPIVYLILPFFTLLACGETTTNSPADTDTGDAETTETTTDNDTAADTTDTTEDTTEVDSTDETTNTDSIQNQVEMTPERARALEIGLSIIQSYFDGEYFGDMVRNSSPYPAGEDYTIYTMEQYEEVYDPLVLTYEEAVELISFPTVQGNGWVPEENDFLFIGGNLKPGAVEGDKFIRDGLNSFVFGIRGGEWKFVGFIS